jgi:hypothetical protein
MFTGCASRIAGGADIAVYVGDAFGSALSLTGLQGRARHPRAQTYKPMCGPTAKGQSR